MLHLFLLTPACLINREVYEERLKELTDHDGDGFVWEDDCDDANANVFPGAAETCDGADEDCDGDVDDDAADVAAWFPDSDADGHGAAEGREWACDAPPGFVATNTDCDDADAAAYPGAADAWYDGVDGNCDGADDFDADADGDASSEFGGTDCDDLDPTVAGTIEEGWWDAGIDNNCDGSVEDQARAKLSDLGVRIDGDMEGGSFGASILTIPAGWADDEPVVLISAPFAGMGDVYGWRASALSGAPTLATAPWHLSGGEVSDFMGYGMAWLGSESAPIVAIGLEGADDTRGVVNVWEGAALADSPTATIRGEVIGGYLGGQLVSGYDHDGDGQADLLVAAPLDSTIATNAGSVFLFLEPDRLTGDLTTAEADVTFTTTYAGAYLAVSAVGDVDGDGMGDLGFDQTVDYDEGPGGLLVAGGCDSGTYAIEASSFAQLYAAGNAYGVVQDWDGDGVGELVVASGGVDRYELPISGVLTPWEDAESRLTFADSGAGVSGLDTLAPSYGGHTTFLLLSSSFDGSSGALFVQPAYWAADATAEDGTFAAVGEAAGDSAGASLGAVDVDENGTQDLVVGAPGADSGGAQSGAAYVVLAPR